MIRDFSSSNSKLRRIFWEESDLLGVFSLMGSHSSQKFSGMSLNEAFRQLLVTVLNCWEERSNPDWNGFLLR
jgi:hypothetical protein